MKQRSGDRATPCTHGGGSCGNTTKDPSGLCHVHQRSGSVPTAATSGKAREAALVADAAARTAEQVDPDEAPDAHVRRIAPGDHFIGMISGPGSGDWRPVRLRRAGDSFFAECHVGPPDDLRLVRTGMLPASECVADDLLRLLGKALSADRYEVRAADNQPMPVGPGWQGMHIDPEVEDDLTAQAGTFLGQIRSFRYWVKRREWRITEALEEDDWNKVARGSIDLSEAKADYLKYLDSAAEELKALQAVVEAERNATLGLQLGAGPPGEPL